MLNKAQRQISAFDGTTKRTSRHRMRPTCYLCDKPFDDVLVKQHGEHVLQNSIGGKLISSEILCEGCGTILGDSVDSAFARDLSPISVLFDVVRDRGQPQPATVEVVAGCAESAPLESVKFQLGSDFSITPTKPIHIKDEKTKRVLIFAATSKQAMQYAQSPNVSKLKAEGFEIVVGGNVADRIQEVVLRINVGSATLLRGILKIAIGFAAHHGVRRAIMAHLFTGEDLINDHSALNSIIFQYYPTTDEEKLFEIEKSGHEDWFPNHQIYLFSRDENLFCYVEIFGVIQKYVHLSNCYLGPAIRKKYLQRAERWEFNEKSFLARTSSDLDILARQFEVETAGRQWDDIQAEITQKAKARAYALDPDSQIEKVSHLMGLLV